MADSSPPQALPEDEQRAAEALLTRAFGEPTVAQAVERLWDRGHVSRLHLASGPHFRWPTGPGGWLSGRTSQGSSLACPL